MMKFLKVTGLTKRQHNLVSVDHVDITISQFQNVAIAGETGSGKSTLLKMIAGLIQPDEGDIVFENKPVEGPLEKLLPGHPKIAYLSQHFELRNNYRVEEELDYVNQLSTQEASDLYAICRISHLLKRKTTEVSGGEKQRISLARLLLSSPTLLLLDEPYSNLDIIHKNILKNVVQDVSEKLNITCILISHDPNDLLSWADEIVIMKEGKLVQRGTPQEIYSKPISEYVAALFGAYNFVSRATYNAFLPEPIEESEEKVFVRPEQFVVNSLQTKFIKGKVKDVRFLGSVYEIEVILDNGEFITARTGLTKLDKGDTIRISLRQ